MANDMVKAEKITELDAVVAEYGLAATNQLGEFEKAFRLAEGIEKLECLITDQMMRPIMRLQNTGIGFKTDQPVRGYPMEVVKRCCIEARLRGLNVVGNEFNIIKDNLYVTKEGLAHLLREWEGLTDLRTHLEVPRISDGEAIVRCSAKWKIDGQDQSIGVDEPLDLPIKVNAGMGSDAILGKATRKLYYRIYTQVSGSNSLPEGEYDEADVRAVESATGRRLGPARFGLGCDDKDRIKLTLPIDSPPDAIFDENAEAHRLNRLDVLYALMQQKGKPDADYSGKPIEWIEKAIARLQD
jgi:hypothetical protein